MAQLIDGTAMAARLVAAVAQRVCALKKAGTDPALAVILVGSDPASEVYVRRKVAQCERAGIRSIPHHLPAGTTQDAVLRLIASLNADGAVHGILVQLPLPPAIDAGVVLGCIDPAKDVDGFHPVNVGRLSTGTGGLIPCTPLGIMKLLDNVVDDYRGLNVVVIGKSNIVGKPIAMLLLEREATVTVTHIETRNLADIARKADIIVAAAGAPHLVRGYWVKPGAVVIDVGITRMAPGAEAGAGNSAGRLVGDCATHELDHAGAVTPMPGGVG
ncbi:MAG: bifunctional 5,10-methylenetetrahydrofolate dehydrogenase/5,10-methenyltetrahydrofolate cyclohydrolase, partial [Sphingopyxis sp.]